MPRNKTLAVSCTIIIKIECITARTYIIYDRIFKVLSFFCVGCHEKKFPNANRQQCRNYSAAKTNSPFVVYGTIRIHIYTHTRAYRQKLKYLSRVVHSETFKRRYYIFSILFLPSQSSSPYRNYNNYIN